MGIEELKRAEVGFLDTPLEYMPRLTEKIGKGKLYIKRDDLTGLALGGNKTRKLDYLLQFAVEQGYTALMTFGGVQTNHGRLTAAAAVKFGMKPILVLKGAYPEYCSGNLVLDRLLGADLAFVDTSRFDGLPEAEQKEKKDAFLAEATKELVKKYESQGEKVFQIPVGGQGILGAAGYIRAAKEIMNQMEAQNIQADYVVCGYGSTGTFAGLWAGAKYYHAPFEVIGVTVEPDYRSKEATAAFINEVSEAYQLGFQCSAEELHIASGPAENPYYGAGYNLPDEETWKYIALLAKTEAVFTDPCYTGKVFHGFVDLVEREVIPRDKNAIFLNTGGSPGLWTKEHLDFIQKKLWQMDDQVTIIKA